MNSIKNTIVTVTLLAVSYGAYVVLSEPPNDGQLAGVDNWNQGAAGVDNGAPVVELPETQVATTPDDPSLVQMPQHGAGQIGHAPADPNAMPAQYPNGAEGPTLPPIDNTAAVDTSQPPHYQSAPPEQYPPTSSPAYPDAQQQVNPPAVQTNTSPAAGPQSVDAFDEAWKSIQSSIAAGQMDDALFALTVWYGEPTLNPEQNQQCVNLLDQLAGSVIYSQDSFMEPAYVVQEGETIEEIAAKYSVPMEFLARINGVEPPYQLYPGETLKVVRGPFRAEVNTKTGEITVFLGRYYAGRFASRLGDDLPDKVNDYEVAAKETGREYFDRRTGFRIDREDPNNPYGNRWIGLRGQQITAAHNVGIHVDNGHPEGGCIAVSQRDADDLAAILSIGSRIVVRR